MQHPTLGPGEGAGVWLSAVRLWRRTGDVSRMCEALATASPAWREMLLDMLVPCWLRRELAHLVRMASPTSCRDRHVELVARE